MRMEKKKYHLSEIDNIDNLPEDAEIVIDDRPRKFDMENGRFVRYGEPGYDDLPEITYYLPTVV